MELVPWDSHRLIATPLKEMAGGTVDGDTGLSKLGRDSLRPLPIIGLRKPIV
jgi:hypothetical protein